jgi:hypothetical protein
MNDGEAALLQDLNLMRTASWYDLVCVRFTLNRVTECVGINPFVPVNMIAAPAGCHFKILSAGVAI